MIVTLGSSTKIKRAHPVVTLVLFALGMFLSAYSSKHPEVGTGASRIILAITSPFQKVGVGAVSVLTSIVDKYVLLFNAERDRSVLELRVQSLEQQLVETKEVKAENIHLRTMLGMRDSLPLEGVVAQVIGASVTHWTDDIVIDRGNDDGVREGNPVLNEDGVVGRVTVVSRNSSRVLLVTDRRSGIDALVQSSRSRGVVEGLSDRRCLLQYVVMSDKVAVGDKVITSGLDGYFPRGLLLGTIQSTRGAGAGMFHSIEVKAAVDTRKIERVMVVQAFKSDIEEEMQKGFLVEGTPLR
jgi:rod shape-determining protein MreC